LVYLVESEPFKNSLHSMLGDRSPYLVQQLAHRDVIACHCLHALVTPKRLKSWTEGREQCVCTSNPLLEEMVEATPDACRQLAPNLLPCPHSSVNFSWTAD